MVELLTLGEHSGERRRLARGSRLVCRPYVDRWASDYEEPNAAIRMIAKRMAIFSAPGDFVTWVPGHDGTLGPGYFLAEALAHMWGLPLVDTLDRINVLPSAHSALIGRPDIQAVEASLATRPLFRYRTQKNAVVVDNVIASGASMLGAVRTLGRGGLNVSAVAAATIDPSAGSRKHICHGPGRTWLLIPREVCS